jgi:hypothetical protein
MFWRKRWVNQPKRRDIRRDGPAFEILSTQTFADSTCECCQYGKLLSFSWKRAGTGSKAKFPEHKAFVLQRRLRLGFLFSCKKCGRPWHLDEAETFMSAVPVERLSIIYEWDRHAITLSREVTQKLNLIGATPPDIYGNGRQYRQTPCSAMTTAGHRFDLAVISIQAHAPFEPHRNYRLGSEISKVDDSPYALPLDVRIATSRAEELSMGFAPTIVEMPDGKLFTLNWTNHFLVRDGYRAADARALGRGASPLPEIVKPPTDIVYFIADG